MNDSLRMRLGAVVLALLTIAAVVFACAQFPAAFPLRPIGRRCHLMDSTAGVTAWHVVADSPAAKAGIKEGDVVQSVRGVPVHRNTDVTKVLFRVAPWTQIDYDLLRDNRTFKTPVVTAPQDNSTSIENYLRITALLYLFIGLFIFVRRWNAPRAVHFYVFCLVSRLSSTASTTPASSTPSTGKFYWGNVIALLLQPALLVHFALVFPERRAHSLAEVGSSVREIVKPTALLTLHIFIATGTLDFLPSINSQRWLDQIELAYLGAYFLLAAGIFLASYFRAPSGVLRQQLKWVTGGTFAGITSVPRLLHPLRAWSAQRACRPDGCLRPVARNTPIPLCFGYAIIRYRLMDAWGHHLQARPGYTRCSPPEAVIAHLLRGDRAHRRALYTAPALSPPGRAAAVIAIVVAAFLIEPLREGVQARLDRFFYRDRLDYRRTLIEFGRTLTNEVRLEPLVGSVLDRVSQTLLVDRLAVLPRRSCRILRSPSSRARWAVRPWKARSILEFPQPRRNAPALERGCPVFWESARSAMTCRNRFRPPHDRRARPGTISSPAASVDRIVRGPRPRLRRSRRRLLFQR